MKEIIINAGSARYLSELKEFKDGIPFGVINKGKPDVGGTYSAMNCDFNYIVVCPYRDLVESLYEDKNNKYEVFRCYGGIKEGDFKKYDSPVKKIAVTFDSLPKLMKWINPDDYKIVVDEYHTILSEMDFREDAINGLLDNITKFKHFSFLSATPISTDFEIDFLKELPHYIVNWDCYEKINLRAYPTSSMVKSIATIIKRFLDEGIALPDINGETKRVEELYIYLNSVTDIKQILDTLEIEPDIVKICCASRLRNQQILDKYEIESATAPNKQINFFTKKGYQGCNLFTNNGLVIVGSNGHKEHTLVDISTDLEQISGRIRFNDESQNCFRNTIIHLYCGNSNILSDDEFEALIKETDDRAKLAISGAKKLSSDELDAFMKNKNIDGEFYSYVDNKIIYNDNKKVNVLFKRELSKSYKDTLCYRKSAEKSNKFNVSIQEYWNDFDVKMKAATTFSYKQMLQDYLENPTKRYEIEFPEFKLIRQYLKVSEMNTLKWVKDKLIKAANDKKEMQYVFNDIYKEGFITCAELKEKIRKGFEDRGITLTPKATLIKQALFFDAEKKSKKINGKTVDGYELSNFKSFLFNTAF